MKKTILALTVLGGLFGLGATAQAQDWASDRFHAQLEQRAYQRQLLSREAHRYPMTHRQHEQLHNYLDYQARQDAMADRAYHQYQGGYSTPYSSQYAPRSSYSGWHAGYGPSTGGYTHGSYSSPHHTHYWSW